MRRLHMHPVFWPMQAAVFWLDLVMMPWKMMMAPMTNSLNPVGTAIDPSAAAGLDPVSPKDIGTSATDFRTEP